MCVPARIWALFFGDTSVGGSCSLGRDAAPDTAGITTANSMIRTAITQRRHEMSLRWLVVMMLLVVCEAAQTHDADAADTESSFPPTGTPAIG
jgi:hypothetical protein